MGKILSLKKKRIFYGTILSFLCGSMLCMENNSSLEAEHIEQVVKKVLEKEGRLGDVFTLRLDRAQKVLVFAASGMFIGFSLWYWRKITKNDELASCDKKQKERIRIEEQRELQYKNKEKEQITSIEQGISNIHKGLQGLPEQIQDFLKENTAANASLKFKVTTNRKTEEEKLGQVIQKHKTNLSEAKNFFDSSIGSQQLDKIIKGQAQVIRDVSKLSERVSSVKSDFEKRLEGIERTVKLISADSSQEGGFIHPAGEDNEDIGK